MFGGQPPCARLRRGARGLVVAATFVHCSAWAAPAALTAPPPSWRHARVFYNADTCRDAGVYSDDECRRAYANAKAEFYEKAPRFETRGECEHYFRRCMIGDFSHGGRKVDFMPSMQGFVIENGAQRRVVPVADGEIADSLFQPRRIDGDDSMISAARTAQAQTAWKLIIAPPPTAAVNPGAGADDDTAGAEPQPGTVKTYPAPEWMQKDLLARERLYGTPTKP